MAREAQPGALRVPDGSFCTAGGGRALGTTCQRVLLGWVSVDGLDEWDGVDQGRAQVRRIDRRRLTRLQGGETCLDVGVGSQVVEGVELGVERRGGSSA